MNTSEDQEFISSIGLRSGERNSKPQNVPNDNWKCVDWFLHTWGFLPYDNTQLDKLSSDQKNVIIGTLLDLAWRKDEETSIQAIALIQERFNEWGLSDYFKDFEAKK